MKIYFTLAGLVIPSSTNENEDKWEFIKPECCKLYQVRYEFQCEKGDATIKVLPAMCKKWFWRAFVYIFEVYIEWSKYIMLNASNKTWINENDIAEELPFPGMTCREANTNLILSYDW